MLTYTRSVSHKTSTPILALRLAGVTFFTLLLLALLPSLYGQASKGPTLFYPGPGGSHQAEAPSLPKPTQFKVEESARQLRWTPKLEFVAREDIVMKFQVRVAPNGTVEYVKSARVSPAEREYWKGAVDALYQTTFTPTTDFDQIEVTVTFPGENSSLMASAHQK